MDTSSVNHDSGNAIFDSVKVRGNLNIKAINTIRKLTVNEKITIGGSGIAANDAVISKFSTDDIERAQYIATPINEAVVIPPLGADEVPVWDVTSVTICGCPGSGALESVNPTTGEITYTPITDFTGTDVFKYTIVDDLGTTRTVFQYVIVAIPATPPFANNFNDGNINAGQGFIPVPFTVTNFVTNYVVAGTNPVDPTTGTVVSGIYDPNGYASGPTPLSALAGFLELTFLPNGDMQLITSPAAEAEIFNIIGGDYFLVGTYTFDDTHGNTSNTANYIIGISI